MLALLSHLARKLRPIEYILRLSVLSIAIFESLLSIWLTQFPALSYLCITYGLAAISTFLILFKPCRQFMSWFITGIQTLITAEIIYPLIRKDIEAKKYFYHKRIFVPSSFPHLIALFTYITTSLYVLTSAELKKLYPSLISLIDPLKMDHLLSCGGVAFIILAFCGVGFYITRSYKQCFSRLRLEKPTKIQIGIGIILIFASFAYDAYWLMYTHSIGAQSSLAVRLSHYNSASFAVAGAFFPSVILALLFTSFTAVGEEILIRGALQPVFGILPSALLHALLHSQLNHAPLFILQVALWSIFMGFSRKYTNTTTAIIGHAGFNLLTVLLYLVNP